MRKPVTGEARTGDTDVERSAGDECGEADGAGAAMSPKAASRRVAGTADMVGGIV